jgi:rubrerythrin
MTSNLKDRLTEALEDEYKARATYRKVIEKFGPVRPFANIVEAEERHIAALLSLFGRYGVPIPEDPWPGRVSVPDTLEEACRSAVEAEQDNMAMYDRLLAATPEPEVRRVLENLQAASRDRHLPAFERCLRRRG